MTKMNAHFAHIVVVVSAEYEVWRANESENVDNYVINKNVCFATCWSRISLNVVMGLIVWLNNNNDKIFS